MQPKKNVLPLGFTNWIDLYDHLLKSDAHLLSNQRKVYSYLNEVVEFDISFFKDRLLEELLAARIKEEHYELFRQNFFHNDRNGYDNFPEINEVFQRLRAASIKTR